MRHNRDVDQRDVFCLELARCDTMPRCDGEPWACSAAQGSTFSPILEQASLRVFGDGGLAHDASDMISMTSNVAATSGGVHILQVSIQRRHCWHRQRLKMTCLADAQARASREGSSP